MQAHKLLMLTNPDPFPILKVGSGFAQTRYVLCNRGSVVKEGVCAGNRGYMLYNRCTIGGADIVPV